MSFRNLPHLKKILVKGGNSLRLGRAKQAFTPRRTKEGEVQLAPPLEESCNHLMVLVDKQHSLPEDYVPRDLVPLRSYRVPTLEVHMLLRQEAAEHLYQLVARAASIDEKLIVTSAYRSFQDQQAIFARTTFVYGEDASKWCALPGQSQHQLGTAVDFTSESANYRSWLPFENSRAAQWLLEHADEYGFVQAYPSGGEAETGYQPEPWHYRYIGVENARRLKGSGLSLHAFLVREGVLPHPN